MSSRNSNDWMWAQACALIDEAERMHRQFFRLGVSERTQAVWEPPVDVFEDGSEIIVVVALPGVAADAVEVTMEPGAVLVRAEARFPFAGEHHVVRRLEIPYGYFERRVPLPFAALEAATRESLNGCLVLRLRKSTGGATS
jgi:HSP20 family protein